MTVKFSHFNSKPVLVENKDEGNRRELKKNPFGMEQLLWLPKRVLIRRNCTNKTNMVTTYSFQELIMRGQKLVRQKED